MRFFEKKQKKSVIVHGTFHLIEKWHKKAHFRHSAFLTIKGGIC